jgi:hypothetical protein
MPEWKVEVISPRDGSANFVEVKAPDPESARQAVAMTGAGVVGGATLMRMDTPPVLIVPARTDESERELADLRPSWLLLAPPIVGACFWGGAGVLIGVASLGTPLGVIVALVLLVVALSYVAATIDRLIYIKRARLMLTTQRVIARSGTMFTTRRTESPLRSVETVGVAQSFLGSILGLATIGVAFTGGTRVQVAGVRDAAVLAERLNREIERHRRHG